MLKTWICIFCGMLNFHKDRVCKRCMTVRENLMEVVYADSNNSSNK